MNRPALAALPRRLFLAAGLALPLAAEGCEANAGAMPPGVESLDPGDPGRSGDASVVRECRQTAPHWLWCDDFEDDRSASYFERDDAGGSFARASLIGLGGSIGMRARFGVGQVDAGNLKLAIGRAPGPSLHPVDDGSTAHSQLFWRFYLRHQPGWVGGGGDKLTRATSIVDADSWAQAMIAHVWSGSDPHQGHLVLDPVSGVQPGTGSVAATRYNDFDRLRWLGAVRGPTPIFDEAATGRWYCIEVGVGLNDPGLANGWFTLWIDERMEATTEGVDWRGRYDGYGINAVFLENWWNGGSPRIQERYFDNFVVSTERVGCLPPIPGSSP